MLLSASQIWTKKVLNTANASANAIAAGIKNTDVDSHAGIRSAWQCVTFVSSDLDLNTHTKNRECEEKVWCKKQCVLYSSYRVTWSAGNVGVNRLQISSSLSLVRCEGVLLSRKPLCSLQFWARLHADSRLGPVNTLANHLNSHICRHTWGFSAY